MPRGKHIRTVAHGLWRQPTSLNNVETYATVPWIIAHGAEAFAAMGTDDLEGHQDLLAHRQGAELRPRRGAHGHHAARGHLRHRRRHAARPRVQGRAARRPLGRLPAGRAARHAHRLREPHRLRLDDGLGRHGRRSTTPPAWSTSPSSSSRSPPRRACGKCVPCRVGTQRMLEILERITAGEGTARRPRPPRAALRRRHRGLALPARRQRPQPGAHHPALLPRRGTWPTSSTSAARPRSAGRSSATPSNDACTGCYACTTACPTKRDQRRAQAAPRRSTRSSASSATPVARSASSTPSRSRPACWPRWEGGRNESHRDRHASEAHHQRHARDRHARARPSCTARQARRHRHPGALQRRGHGRLGRLPPLPDRGRGLVDKLQAACTTWVDERPRRCSTETPRVRAKRESYLKMYLSDHDAYCEAPCSHACPTHIDIPAYMAALADGDAAGAVGDRAPTTCPSPASSAASARATASPSAAAARSTSPIAICALHRAAGDQSPAGSCPARRTGKRVAVDRRRPGRPLRRLVSSRAPATPSPSTTATTSPAASLRYSIPAFRLPEAVLDTRARAALGGRRALRRRRRAGLRGRPRRPARRRLRRRVRRRRRLARAASTRLAGAKAALDGLEFLRALRDGKKPRLGKTVAVIGDGITALDVARTARRLGANERHRHRPPRAPTTLPAGARELAAARDEGVEFVFARRGQEGQDRQGRQGARASSASRVVRASADGKLRPSAARASTWPPPPWSWPPTTRPDVGDTDDELGFSPWGTLEANQFTGRTPDRRRVRRPATPYRPPSRRSTPWPAASAPPSPSTPGCAARTSTQLEADARRLRRPALPRPAQRRRPARRARPRLAETLAGVAQDGRRRRRRRRAPRCPQVGKVKRLTATDVEVEKGSQPGRRPRPRRPAACSACAPANGDCELQRLGVEYDVTDNDLVVKGALVRQVEPQPRASRSSAATWTAASPAAAACGCAATWPARPATTSPAAASPSNVDTPYGEALQLADCITCGRCVTACPTGALTFNERELALVPRRREPLHHVPRSASTSARSTPSRRPTTSRTRASKWLELVAQGSKLAGGHRMCAGCGAPIVVRQVLMGTERPGRGDARPPAASRSSTTIYPYTSWKGSYIHTAFENAAATLSRRRDRLPRPQEEGQDRGQRQVHRLRRRRRHLRHRPAVALRRHGARPQHALRLLRQRRLHEHRLPALRRHAGRRLDDHQPGGQGARPASCRTARTSPTS